MPGARAVLFTLALCLAAGTGRGESYVFSGLEAPSSTLQELYKFYIYAGRDDPFEAAGQPYIELSSVVEVPRWVLPSQFNGLHAGDALPSEVELTLVPYAKLWGLINPDKFCKQATASETSSIFGAQNELVLAGEEVLSFLVPARVAADTPDGGGGHQLSTPGESGRLYINRTDIYALVLSNCGNRDVKIQGRATVTNVFGYLPGDKFYRMGFYALLLRFYMVLAVLWIIMVCCWKMKGKRLNHLHHCISFVVVVSVIESFVAWYFLLDWNGSSERSETLFTLNIVVPVIKAIFSYAVILNTSLGWGITRADLDKRVVLKVIILGFFYSFLHVLWEILSFYRHAYDVSNKVLATVYTPVLLVNMVLFVWILRALGRTSEKLEGDSRSMFKKLRGLMILALFGSLVFSVVQLMDLAGAITEKMFRSRTPMGTAIKWHYQWFLFDGTGQIIFGVVFVGVLCQWAPQRDTDRYLYTEPVSQDGDDEEGAIARPVPPPDVLGAAGDDSDI